MPRPPVLLSLAVLAACTGGKSENGPAATDGSAGDTGATAPTSHCGAAVAQDLDPSEDVVEVELVADEATWDPGTGIPIQGYAYNGQVPGPLIVLEAGQTLRVRFRNDMDAFDTTVHWHGLRVPNAMDGAPLDHDQHLHPGESFDYEFAVEDPGFYWYHAHVDTDQLIDRGLYGLLWVRDPAEPDTPCQVLALDDVNLDRDGQVLTESNSMDRHMGHLGGTLLVNGQVNPELALAPGGHSLWRIVNAANARYYDLELEGHVFTVVGTDGGWLEEPYETERLLVAPGERYTVLVRGEGETGGEYALLTHRVELHMAGTSMTEVDPLGDGPTTMLSLRYGDEVVEMADPVIPAVDLPDWEASSEVAHTWRLEEWMGDGGMMDMVMGIDGEVWPDVTPVTFEGGTPTTLRFRNRAMGRHPLHLHGQRFQVVEINGEPVERRAWKDTVDVPEGATLTFVSELDNPGDWMMHCHILEHGQDGMMTYVKVE